MNKLIIAVLVPLALMACTRVVPLPAVAPLPAEDEDLPYEFLRCTDSAFVMAMVHKRPEPNIQLAVVRGRTMEDAKIEASARFLTRKEAIETAEDICLRELQVAS